MKKFLCMILMVCILSSTCVVGAAETDVGEGAVPMANKLVLNNPIIKKSISWYQSSNYTSYRVWVDNTTSQRMTVTITSQSALDQHTFYVPANGNKTYTVNAAVSGAHTITFTTASGNLSGTVRVRVSEEPL